MIHLTSTDMKAVLTKNASYLLEKGAEAYRKEDYEYAVEYYRLASSLGNVQAISNLGYCYLYGRSIKKNIDLAIAYFEIAADLENIDALYKLGDIYQRDKWGRKDTELAIYYFQQAIFLIIGRKGYSVEEIEFEDDLTEYPSLCLTLGQAHMEEGLLFTNRRLAYAFLQKAREGYEESFSNNVSLYERAYSRTIELLENDQFTELRTAD